MSLIKSISWCHSTMVHVVTPLIWGLSGVVFYYIKNLMCIGLKLAEVSLDADCRPTFQLWRDVVVQVQIHGVHCFIS